MTHMISMVSLSNKPSSQVARILTQVSEFMQAHTILTLLSLIFSITSLKITMATRRTQST